MSRLCWWQQPPAAQGAKAARAGVWRIGAVSGFCQRRGAATAQPGTHSPGWHQACSTQLPGARRQPCRAQPGTLTLRTPRGAGSNTPSWCAAGSPAYSATACILSLSLLRCRRRPSSSSSLTATANERRGGGQVRRRLPPPVPRRSNALRTMHQPHVWVAWLAHPSAERRRGSRTGQRKEYRDSPPQAHRPRTRPGPSGR